jgi:hypothetical protein
VRVLCNGLHATQTATWEHCKLLEILMQYACNAATLTTTEPHKHVPEDLKEILLTLKQVDAGYPLRQSDLMADKVYTPALMSVARHEPDLFPKTLARTIVHTQLEPLRLWSVACDVIGMNVEGIDVTRINNNYLGREYLWDSLITCTPNALKLLITPQAFSRILDAFEEQLK